jgi:hypothetical protein
MRLKDNILMALDYVFSFLDDDGVFSKSREQHWTHLRALFAILTAKVGDLDLIGDSSTGTFRPLLPRDLRRQIFEHLHGTAHPGRRATRRVISSRYVWKGLSTDVTAWAKACVGCQRAKVHCHVQVPPQHIPVPTCRFSHIHVELVWAPCRHPKVLPICSPSLTEPPAGPRRYLSLPLRQ